MLYPLLVKISVTLCFLFLQLGGTALIGDVNRTFST
jgi:hypothetical protein